MSEWSKVHSHARAAAGQGCKCRLMHGGRATYRREPRLPTKTYSDEVPTRSAPAVDSSLGMTTTLGLGHLSPSLRTEHAGSATAAHGLVHRTSGLQTGRSNLSSNGLASSSTPCHLSPGLSPNSVRPLELDGIPLADGEVRRLRRNASSCGSRRRGFCRGGRASRSTPRPTWF